MRSANTLTASLIFAMCLSIGALATEVPTVIAAENVASLEESMRFETGLGYFQGWFLSDNTFIASDLNRSIIWDLHHEEALAEFTRTEVGRLIGLSADRSTLAAYDSSRMLKVMSIDPLRTLIELGQIDQTDFPEAEFSPNQRSLAVTNRWNDVEIWDLETGNRLHNLTGHSSNMFSLAFSPDGSMLATGGGVSAGTLDDSCIKIWRVASGDLLATLATPDLGDNHEVTFTRDGLRLLSAGNYRLLAWDTTTWERVFDSGRTHPGSYGISLSPDGLLLAMATDNRKLRILDVETLSVARNILMGIEVINVDFSPDGSKLAVSLVDGTVGVWEIPFRSSNGD